MAVPSWLFDLCPIDLGQGHRASYMPTGNVLHYHPCPDPTKRLRVVDLVSGLHHRLVSASPLHIEPSLLCEFCDEHGYIRDGLWSNASAANP